MTVLITHAHTDTYTHRHTHTCTHTDTVYRHLHVHLFFIFISAQALMWPAVLMQSAKAPLILLSKFGQLTAGFTAAEWTQTLFSLKLVCFYSLSSFYRYQQLPAVFSLCLAFHGLASCSCEIVFSGKKSPHRLRTHQGNATQQIQSSGSTQHMIRAWFTKSASVFHYQFCYSLLFHVSVTAV